MSTATKKKSSKKIQLQPLGDRVVVEREASEERTAGGIVLPDTSIEGARTFGEAVIERLKGRLDPPPGFALYTYAHEEAKDRKKPVMRPIEERSKVTTA